MFVSSSATQTGDDDVGDEGANQETVEENSPELASGLGLGAENVSVDVSLQSTSQIAEMSRRDAYNKRYFFIEASKVKYTAVTTRVIGCNAAKQSATVE